MFPDLTSATWAAVVVVAALAGFVKGSVGFGMPMIMISGLGSLLDPKLALAALLIPTALSNGLLAFRDGLAAAAASAKKFKRYILIVLLMIVVSSQLVNVIATNTLFLLIGIPVVVFATLQLAGLRLPLTPDNRRSADFALGGAAGFFGGISGVWGPPTVLYLTSLETPKKEQMRVQGIVYGLASIALVAAHIGSGVLNPRTAPFSALLVVPGLIGIALGFKLSNALNQALFRKVTLVVLIIAGLNLLRRGIAG
ncbi:MAG: sulfite exporter TauE/SafE family protein [Pseudomonadota bacterium]